MERADNIFNGLSKLLKALWLFVAGVIAVLMFYFLLTSVEQGVDVVIQSGESLDAWILSIICVFLWAFLVWYSCRTLSYIRQFKDDELFSSKAEDDVTSAQLYNRYCIPARLYRHVPRLLAYNCFVCIQVSIFHLPTFFSWSTLIMLLVVVAHNLFYFLLDEWFASERGSLRRWSAGFDCVLIIVGYLTLIPLQKIVSLSGMDLVASPERHKFWLSAMVLALFLLQVAVVYFFIVRRRSIDARRKNSKLRASRWLHIIGYNPAFNAAEAPYFVLLNATATVAIGVFMIAIFVMDFASLMGPMALVLLALGILTGFSNLVTLASIRSSFNVMILLLAMAVLFGQWRDPYTVRLFETGHTPIFASRPDTQQWLRWWFKKRIVLLDSVDTSKKFPVYIVLSDGGASRAGKWTSGVLSHLQDTYYRAGRSDDLRDHLLCIAGASGGTVGNCAFYSLLKAELKGEIKPDEFRQHSDAFFESDFLTYTLARLFGPDIFRHLIPFDIPVDNRADALERALSNASTDTLLNGYFSKPVSEVFDLTGALPALFINTTQVDNGMPGVISSVRLPVKSQRQDVLSLVDSMGMRYGTGDMRLSTAAVLSSRFPYVSPAGKVFDRYYVDGGYFDNSGAGTVLEFIDALNRFMTDSVNADLMQYRDRFAFHILHLTNSEVVQHPTGSIHPLANDLLAPLLTLAGMQGSSTSIGDGLLEHAFSRINADPDSAIVVYSLYDEHYKPGKNQSAYEEGYPMSWALSHYQRHRMDAALKRATRKNRILIDY